MVNNLFEEKEYGAIHLHLDELMKKQGINRNQLARKVGTRFEVIDKWQQDKVERLDLDILARICYVLDCDIADILEYKRA